MRPPFPGMDPWLEHPDVWSDVHASLITAIRDTLNPQVVPRYVVRVESRTTVLTSLDVDLVYRPDVAVRAVDLSSPVRGAGVTLLERTQVEPFPVVVPIEEDEIEETLWFLLHNPDPGHPDPVIAGGYRAGPAFERRAARLDRQGALRPDDRLSPAARSSATPRRRAVGRGDPGSSVVEVPKGERHELPGPSLPPGRSAAGHAAAGSSSNAASGWARSRWDSFSRRRVTPGGSTESTAWQSSGSQAPHYAPKAKRVLFLFMAGAPSHLELFDNKPQLAKFDGTLPPAELLKGYRAAFIKPELEAARPQVQVRQARPVRHRALRVAAAPGDGRRRHRGRQGDGHRRVQPRAGADHDEHRRPDLRPAQHGCLGLLRPGQRVAGPAGFRRLQHRQEGPQRRQFQLGQRLLADGLPGRPVPHQRRPGALPLQPARHRSRAPARLARRRPEAQPAAARESRRPRDRHADQFLRDGLPDAADRARRDGHRPRAAAHPRAVRCRAGQAVVRQHLPAGPTAARARRAVRADLPRVVGPARQPGARHQARTARTPTRPAPP